MNYNNYRTRYELINMLEQKNEMSKYVFSKMKHDLRKDLDREAACDWARGKCIKQYDDGTVIMLVPIVEAYFFTEKEKVIRIFEDLYEIKLPNSPYDCTGQAFTSWYKVFKRRGIWYAYHCISYDF